MNIDIRTLAILISLSNVLQIIALFLQYRVNKVYKGIGWWVMGFISMAIGYILLFLRDYISIKLITVISANSLILLGSVFLYIGIMRFLDRKENRVIVISIFLFFIVSFFYYTYFSDDIALRTVIIYAAAAIISFLATQSLFLYKTRSIMESALFNTALFFIQGCFYTFRAVIALTVDPVNTLFTATLIQAVSFLFVFAEGVLLTFGLIILVNQRLNAENREAKENLELIFNTNPDAVLITRLTDGHFVEINDGFAELSGYTRAEVVGKSTLEINIWKNPEDRQRVVMQLTEKGTYKNMEAVFVRKNGSQLIGMMSAVVFTLQEIPHVLSVTRDITERKQAEDKIKSLLADKEMILKEVHHRIKNNMNSVYGLLILQSQTLTDLPAITALEEAGSRVHSMALLYDKLYRSADYNDVRVQDYLVPLVDEILANFPNSGSVKVEKKIDDFTLSANQLQPLGIIINELLTNIMKYAFTGKQDGFILVGANLKPSPDGKGNHVSLVIQDNGNGIPESIDFENTSGFGLMLVGGLTGQLGGTIRIERQEGTRIILEFAK